MLDKFLSCKKECYVVTLQMLPLVRNARYGLRLSLEMGWLKVVAAFAILDWIS